MNLFLVLWLAACNTPSTDATDAPAAENAAKKRGKKAAGAEAEQAEGEEAGKRGKAKGRPPGKPVELKGTLSFDAEGVASFLPCGASAPIELLAGSGNPAKVREDLGNDVTSAYVEVRGLRDGEGPLVVRAFDVAIVDGPGCEATFTDRLRATGNEPGWSLTVNDAGTVLTRMDQPDLALEGLVKTATDRMTHTFQSPAAGVEGGVKVVLQRKRCADTMASAFYPWTATVELAGTTLTGCGRGVLPGTAPKPAPGAAPVEGAAGAEVPAEPAAGEE
jgi:putative lipoprotein